MQSDLFQAICQMGIFMICAQSIVHFRPKASYEKYLKLLVSVMVLIQLFLPIGRLVFGSSAEGFAGRVEAFERSLDMGMEQAEESARQSQEKLEQMTLDEVQKLLPEEEKIDGAVKESGSGETGIKIEIGQVEQIQIETEGEGQQAE